jgi:hypothetical protein
VTDLVANARGLGGRSAICPGTFGESYVRRLCRTLPPWVFLFPM